MTHPHTTSRELAWPTYPGAIRSFVGTVQHLAAVERERDELRVELVETLGAPTTCRVWRKGVLAFEGRSGSPDIEAPQPSEDTRAGDEARVARRAQAVTRLQMHHDPAQCPDGGCQIISLMDRAEAAEARADRLAATLAEVRRLCDQWNGAYRVPSTGRPVPNVNACAILAILDREADGSGK